MIRLSYLLGRAEEVANGVAEGELGMTKLGHHALENYSLTIATYRSIFARQRISDHRNDDSGLTTSLDG